MKIEYEVMAVGESIYSNTDRCQAKGFESEEKAEEWITQRKYPRDFPGWMPVYYIRKTYKAGD